MQNDTRFGLGTGEVRRRHILPKALVVGLVAEALRERAKRLEAAQSSARRWSVAVPQLPALIHPHL